MANEKPVCQFSVKDMRYQEDWRILLSLAKRLEDAGIPYKVDGKTMLFAHGMTFPLDKICLTFKWHDEPRALAFFGETGPSVPYAKGFKYFDTRAEGMKVRCMFYGDCPADHTDTFLYRNTDRVEADGQILPVQTVDFYLQNAEPDGGFYQEVERWYNGRG